MPPTLPIKPIRMKRPVGRSVRTRVTSQKYAAVTSGGGVPYHVEPRERMRPIVAAMGSEASMAELLELCEPYLESPQDLRGVSFGRSDDLRELLALIARRVPTHGVGASVRPRPVHRLGWGSGSYPLRRTQLVSFNHERGGKVVAELKEVSKVLGIRGVGVDQDTALRDLERQFEQLVVAKVRIPPHERLQKDDHIRSVVNHLVDWEQYDRENPLPSVLLGQVVKHTPFGPTTVRWVRGPGGIRDQVAAVPQLFMTPYLLDIPAKAWFRGVAKIYPDNVEWIEPPQRIPNPDDKSARKRAWDAIPKVVADDPAAWPTKSD